jgi:2',3'-cyclic-nucleotide 2'-phosphodiesterase/3'-nucleotidase
MVSTAREWVTKLRPQVDVLVGVFHAGMDEGYSQEMTDALNLPNENSSRRVAEQVPGFDVILCGHSHRLYPYKENDPPLINGTLFLMSGSHGRYVSVAKLMLNKDNKNKWKLTERSGEIMAMDTVQAAAEILAINDPYHLKTLEYIRQAIGTAGDTITGRSSCWKDTPLVQFINQVQMIYTGTEISFAASFNDSFVLLPGPILVKDVYRMYKYENFLYTVEMNGQQIKDYLEHSARYFIVDPQTGKVKTDPGLPGYYYDMAEGLDYEIDVRAAAGERIKNLKESKTGLTVDRGKIYRVAMNSYRAAGGGGHLTAAGIRNARIIWKSSEEIRNLIIQYIKTQGTLESRVDHNWKLTGL